MRASAAPQPFTLGPLLLSERPVVFLPPDSTSGVLYVASANYDRRYDQGNLLAVDLDNVAAPGSGLDGGLPGPGLLGGDVTPAIQFTTLNTDPTSDVVQIQSFAGEMLRDAVGYGGRPRLWVATRAEGDLLEGVSTDPSGFGLICIPGREQLRLQRHLARD